MSRKSTVFGARPVAAWGIAAALVCAISYLPAGIGNVGRSQLLPSGSQVDVNVEGNVFTHVIVPGESVTQVRNDLVRIIDLSPSYKAVIFTDPGDPNGNSFYVTHQDGSSTTSMSISEDSIGIQDSGTRTLIGGMSGTLGRVTAAGNPATLTAGIYRLVVDVWDGADFDQTFTTGPSGITTAAALDTAISGALASAGFTVASSSTAFTISKSNNMIMAVRVDSLGSGLIVNQTGYSGAHSVGDFGSPTLSQLGMFVLVLMMTLAAIVVMRRKAASTR
jgi:hypothetical protein